MNTTKLSLDWWNKLPFGSDNEINRTDYCLKYYKHNYYYSLKDEEIENIFYNEVILKWYVGKYGKIEFDYNEKEIRNIYLKEHSKEEPKDVILGYKTSLDAQMLDNVEPKQETLEEAAFRLYPRLINDPYNPKEDDNKEYRDIWISGAKWKQKTTLEDIKLEVVLESSHCQFSVVENKLATIYRNQEKILTAIKLLNNGK